MSLSDRLDAAKDSTKDRCPFGRLLASMPTEDREACEAALRSNLSSVKIHAAIRAEGYNVSRSSLGLHRSGECYCKVDA